VTDPTTRKAEEGRSGSAAAWYTLAVLVVFALFSYLDRQIISLLVVPMQQDLGLSDVEVGMLQGLAFSAIYALAGIPAGWAVDRYSRRTILWAGLTIWSLGTALCGLGRNFAALFATRFMVGAGEAVLNPAAYSILAAKFPRHRLGTVFAIYTFGSVVGGAAALAIGGYIIDAIGANSTIALPVLGAVRGWQLVFIVVGAPGLLFALLSFTFEEPAQAPRKAGVERDAGGPGVLAYMARHSGFFAAHIGGFSLVALMIYALVAWMPTYFIRQYHWTIAEAGSAIGIMSVVSGAIGVSLGGVIADHLYKRGIRNAHFQVMIGAVLLATLSTPFAFFASNPWVALALMFVPKTVYTYAGVAGSALQLATPTHLRGRMSAIYLCVTGLVGVGLGPVLAGYLSEHVLAGRQHIGIALAAMFAIVGPLAIIAFWLGLRPMREAILSCERAETV
jgi:MFS family permease